MLQLLIYFITSKSKYRLSKLFNIDHSKSSHNSWDPLFMVFIHFTASMIHWARQIKEVLSSQDAFEMAENSGPLDEIEFWKNRCADLSGITTQLDKPGVKKITHILELAKSSYVTPFLKLSGQIKVR